MKKTLPLIIMALSPAFANAQSCADYLKALKTTDTFVPFDVNSEGEAFHVKWGMDTAWDWDFNVTRGINYYGEGNFETGRVSFQPIDLVTDNGNGTYTLSARQRKKLDWRIELIKRTGTSNINLNCDHEVLFSKVGTDGSCMKDDQGENITDYTGRDNYVGKPEEWVKLIKATAQYCQKNGLTVVSVSPFNEPDYTAWTQYSGSETNGMKDFLAIAKLIKADPFFDGIRVCGGNTLNNDKALTWYNYIKEYLDEGNTHQLAGTFDNYAKFFQTVKTDGKVATADELHNVGEAIVGVQYGMENGIWWGFDSRARGQFMHDSNEGVRIGYGENRKSWTSAAVYKNNKTGEVHGYFGSSERQATPASYTYVSTAKDVYFNGYGPTRMFVYDVPGGTGYQKGQINAERVFDITWGEDVPSAEINGTYRIFNAGSKKMLHYNGTSNVQMQTNILTSSKQKWNVYPGYTDGDVSYWFIDNINTSSSATHLNVRNNNLSAGADVMCYDAGHGAVEQWYLKYAGNGYYYIISRLSNMYLYGTTSGVKLQDAPTDATDEATKLKYMWRFQPADIAHDITAPKAPTALTANAQNGSIALSWTAPADADLASYTILRAENGEWNTIGRGVEATQFIDNSAIAGKQYTYKIIALDKCGNRSVASEETSAEIAKGTKALLCQLQFDNNFNDNSQNALNASFYGTEKFQTSSLFIKSGSSSLGFDGKSYAMIPYSSATNDEMTIATWIRWNATSGSWQRVFDFGNNETQYMFFTPSNGSEMRFVMKKDGDEQILTNNKKLDTFTKWHHVAVTIKPLDSGKVQAILYVDGEVIAESNEFTIKPSDIAPSLCFIGRSMFAADPMFSGQIDDFRIYNYSLSQDEVKKAMTDLGEVAEDISTDITEVTTGVPQRTTDNAIYDLTGRKISNPTKGFYIQNGKKFYKK